jgi:hypothetical protein
MNTEIRGDNVSLAHLDKLNVKVNISPGKKTIANSDRIAGMFTIQSISRGELSRVSIYCYFSKQCSFASILFFLFRSLTSSICPTFFRKT